jgi:FkbM family methyltransferase
LQGARAPGASRTGRSSCWAGRGAVARPRRTIYRTLMLAEYPDFSAHIGLRLAHQVSRLRRERTFGAVALGQIVGRLFPRPMASGPCVVKTIHGHLMIVDPVFDSGVERTLFDEGTYEEGTLRILENLLPAGGLFVDVGANIGLLTLHAAKILGARGHVLAFEPVPATYEILRKNIEINGYDVTAVRMALGSTSGTAEIYDNLTANRGSSSLLPPDRPRAGHVTRVERLDEVLARRPAREKVACIKIDVEGWELEVLKGATGTLAGSEAPWCIVECTDYHPLHGGTPEDLFDFFRGINTYRIFRLEAGKSTVSRLVEILRSGDLPEHDNLFCMLQQHVDLLPRPLIVS